MTTDHSQRRVTFDQVALLYDQARPGYPAALFDDVVALSRIPPGGRILEIGCGTGQATIKFARRGYHIHCIEMGANLAAVARINLAAYPRAGVSVAAFETWLIKDATFDLAVSATAFHRNSGRGLSDLSDRGMPILSAEGSFSCIPNHASRVKIEAARTMLTASNEPCQSRRDWSTATLTNTNIQRKTFRYRLYPSKAQAALLTEQLGEACRLYNAALQERRDAWKLCREPINYYTQANQLKEIRANGDLSLANFSACQDVLRRVDKTFKAFFRRVEQGVKAGFPRFKSASRFDSYTFPSCGDGCRLLPNGKIRLQGVGAVKAKLHRPIEGTIKTVTIKREAGRWYACFSVECEAKPLPINTESVGVDVGLTAFATLSDGTEIENPRYYREAQMKLRRAQRKVAHRKKGSHRRRKAVLLLQKVHSHIRNQRSDFHHKISRRLVNNYGMIAVEDLNIKSLTSRMLAKSIMDAGWSAFVIKLAEKAEEAARMLIKVDPRGTSQICLCGADVLKDLSQRWHHCSECGLSAPRDHVSAQVILLRAGIPPSRLKVNHSRLSLAREAVCFS